MHEHEHDDATGDPCECPVPDCDFGRRVVTFKIEGKVYESGTLVLSYDLAEGAVIADSRDAEQLLASYIMASLYQGSTVTYNRTHREFCLAGSGGESVEYVKPPREG